MSGSTNKPSHLRALLKKNWIIWRRSCCVSLLEIIIPVLFVFFLVLFRSVFPTDDMPLTDYLTKPGYLFEYDGAITPSDSQYFKDCSARKNGGVVALIPQGDALIEDIKTLLEGQLGITTQYFTSIDEINEFTSRTDYASTLNLRLCFGVVVTKNNIANKYEYTLMFNSTQLDDDNQDVPQTGNPRISELEREDADSLNEYGRSGFLALQNMIDNLILRAETVSTANIYNEVTSMIVPAYVKDDLAINLKGQTRLFLDLPLLLPFLRFINGMVTEKEKRIREGMKIMGLTNAAFYLSWFITYGIIFTIISLLVSIISVAGFFKYSSFGYIFLWHWEFTMCLIALGFFISIFFSKAKQANVAGFVVALLLGFFQEFASSDSRTKGAVIGASIAPEASLGLAADHILSLEAAQLGLTHESVGVVINNYKIAYHYALMLVDIIVLLVLGSYLDQVLPSEFGIKKHPLFCCMRKRSNKLKKRNSQIADEADNMLESKENFEETDPILKAQDSTHESVMVQGLRKVYSTGKLAVDRVSFSMYKNQIFVLLGHNGAGKTSTISMITGLFSSTEGTTKVFGMDNQVQLDEIRKTMGVCPQHDILFDNMTVREHLQLYSVFKGVDPKEAPAEIEKIISDIGLADKRDYLAKNLSGGQKRKLSIGIAFLGGSKFIILDEPSSGMDTSARRKLWDMLKNYKQDRVVLLTTHFMDEADYLGDRIGIMGEGKLKCLGRSLFLKSKFGVGYNLTLVKKDINDPSKPIKEMILRHVPEGKVLSDVSAEVALQLPSAAAPKFQALFDELDKNLEKLRVSSYGISETTLEEVFLNVAKITTPEKHFQKDESPEAKIQMAEEDDLNEFDIRKDGMHGNWDLFKTHFSALVVKRVQYFKRDKRGLVCEVFLPILMVIVGILLSKIDFEQSNPALTLVDDLYGYKFQVDYNDISATSTGYSNFISNFNSADFAMTAKPASTTLAAFDQEVFNDQGQDILDSPVNVFSFYMDTYDETNHNYKYTTFINTRAQEGTAFAMNKINNAILQRATGNSNKQISVTTLTFKETENEKTFDNVVSGAIFAFVFAIGMSFIPASVVTFMVKEREMNVKHQQVVSGVSLFAYWFANYFVDIVKYLVPAIVNSLIAMAFNASSLIDGTKLSGLWAVFLLYGFSVTPFVYLLSFLFRNYGTAQIASFFINFGPGFIGGVAVGILKLIDSTRSAGQALQWILRILPTFAMTNGFLNLANREALAVAEGQANPSAVWSADLTGGDVLFLVIGSILFTILIFVVEHLKNKQSLSSIMTGESKVPYVPKEMDDDVKREEIEVEQSDNKTYAIKVDKLRKVYALEGGKHKVAVDRVSFGVRNGECFALLGVNGAGKTTTFKILSGDYLQTSGNAYINGYTIPGQMEEARKDIGYCPQFDALLDNLTAKEHLELYAAIKGIPKNYRSRLVDKQLREMNLKQYENILAGTYSGGNKRKLSVAIAMIGNPAVVFLDEPSTGMDPEARRFMWNVISRISRERKQSSVILTTHSMEEAEALATKMGIMVNGGLKCLGTSQHIKNKFGGGYEIEVKLNLPHQQEISGALKSVGCKNGQRVDRSEVEQMLEKMNMLNLKNELTEEGSGSAVYTQLQHGTAPIELVMEWILIETNGDKLMNFLHENFGQMTVMEHFQSFFRFQTTGFVTIGKFFGALEANKNALNIQQYSIRQTTIEQIFNNFATEKVHVRVESRGEISIPVENRAELPATKNPQN